MEPILVLYSRTHPFLSLESVFLVVPLLVTLCVLITTLYATLFAFSYHQDTHGIPSYNETIECSNVFYRALHSELCANCWVVPINTTSVMCLFFFLSDSRNRCIPVVNSTTETTARCVVPESPADPSDPNYIDPNSRECLAQSVETKQTKTQASNQDIVTNALLNFQVFVGRTASDVQASYLVIALGVLLSFVLGFFFLVPQEKSVSHSFSLKRARSS